MSYIIYTQKPTAKQTHNSFKLSTHIAESANGSRTEAERLLSRAYWKAIVAAAGDERRQAVGLLPPANNLWTWNRSLEIALEVAAQQSASEVAILVPNSANIVLGKDTLNVSDEEAHDLLDDLDFALKDNVRDTHDTTAEKMAALAQASRDEEEIIDGIIADCTKGFSYYLKTILAKTKMRASTLARKANLTTSAVAKLRDGEVPVPPKSTVLAIGVALKLDRAQFAQFMQSAGYMFSTSVPRDQIVLHYVEQGVSDVSKINKILFLKELPVLGAHAGEGHL